MVEIEELYVDGRIGGDKYNWLNNIRKNYDFMDRFFWVWGIEFVFLV